MANTISPDSNFPATQTVEPVRAQLGYTLTLTPEVSSGLPSKAISVTKALVAEVIKATPTVGENASYTFGMNGAMLMMPRIGRNVYELSASIINGRPDCVSIYSFIQLMSVADALITNMLELDSGLVNKPVKLLMRNSTLMKRPDFLGIVAGSKEISDVVNQVSFMGTIDYSQTSIGDGLANIVSTLGNALGVAGAIANIVRGG